MILVDTSVWADHFRSRDAILLPLLADGQVVIHPFVIGELAFGNLRDWDSTVATLRELPTTSVEEFDSVLSLVARARLAGSGLGFIDSHLLATAIARPGLRLWTRDKRLKSKAETLGVAWKESPD